MDANARKLDLHAEKIANFVREGWSTIGGDPWSMQSDDRDKAESSFEEDRKLHVTELIVEFKCICRESLGYVVKQRHGGNDGVVGVLGVKERD